MQQLAHQIYFCHKASLPFVALNAHFTDAQCHDFSGQSADGVAQSFERLSVSLLEHLHQCLRRAGTQLPLVQVVLSEVQFAQRSGIAGLFRSIASEYPEFRGQVIAVNAQESLASLTGKLRGNAQADDRHVEILYRYDQRYALDWQELTLLDHCPLPWQPGNVYLITGGLGAVGRLLIEEIVSQGISCRVILVGRSSVDETARQQLEAWARAGVLVSYRRTDVADPVTVDALIAWVLETFGRLDGVIHCAGIIRDNLLLNKTVSEFEQVLSPKVRGAVNLDQSTRSLPLSFFALFSSLSSVLGNAGQSDYATGNGFMDGYARLRAQRVRAGQGAGRSVSINWPYWKDGGMRMDPHQVERMWQDSGLRALSTANALNAFYQALVQGDEQVLVVEGDARRIRQVAATLHGFSAQVTVPDAIKPPSKVTQAGTGSRSALLAHLTRLVAVELGLAEQRIQIDALLSKYGIDSVMMMRVIGSLESDFGSLPKTLFFEYQTLAELADFFVAKHADVVANRWPDQVPEAPGKDVAPAVVVVAPVQQPVVRSDYVAQPVADSDTEQEPLIAIVAVAGRYPGADSVDVFWEKLADGYDGISQIPPERWNAEDFYSRTPVLGKSTCKWGGFLDDVASFDPAFFNLTPREASVLDPNGRLFLQTVQHLFDSAGLTRQRIAERYRSKIGVFVGAMYQQYSDVDSDLLSESLVSISSYSSIANRVSHAFDLQGPSLALDTMCSSSLVALHYARQSLLRGECNGAIVGGVNLSLHPKKYIGLGASNMLGSAPDSRSFSNGSGYLPSEGVGAVLLRPLSDALRDQDEVLGVIRSSHVSHSGGASHYATPNAKAQTALIRESLEQAGVAANSISYIEAAANGATLSDAVEMLALRKVFTEPGVACAIGTVKSNIGHAEAASGLSQLTKVLLQLKHRKWLPTPGIQQMNTDIDLQQAPFQLQSTLCDWPQPIMMVDGKESRLPRRAAINSFGAGGTYAHVIVEEFEALQPQFPALVPLATSEQLIVLSANSVSSLRSLATAHVQRLSADPSISLTDYARALRQQREAMDVRLATVVSDVPELIQNLQAFCAGSEDWHAPDGASFAGAVDAPDTRLLETLAQGRTTDSLIEDAVNHQRLILLAALWANGIDIDWRRLDGNEPHRPVTLPLYPFDKVRCWVDTQPPAAAPEVQWAGEQPQGSSQERIRGVLSEVTGLPATTWREDRALSEYGLGSATFILFYQRLSASFGEFTLDALRDCQTLNDIVRLLDAQPATPVTSLAPRNLNRRYPELVALNQGRSGRPVFWIHAGIGGVEAYQTLAQRIERPFFGIQARGYMTERAPLQGLQAMAAYYCHLILMQQPSGPYALGGYSLGGALAYEVTRQLQELGETVESLVMVDSLDSHAMSGAAVSTKTLYLQSANIAIGASYGDDLEQALENMIHQEQIDSDVSDEDFLQALAERACQHSADVSVSQLMQRIRHNAKVQSAYDSTNFLILPLPQPAAIQCHYLHNRGGNYFGGLQPYLFVRGEHSALGQTDYAQGWKRQIPDIEIVEVDALCHMLMLSTEPALDQISSYCQRLYATNDSAMPEAIKTPLMKSVEA
ncbi:SDR family NAD(P)-dependent oxidoreductase [Pseudomonas sp. N3-W]|uniref:SDR family NAD(P)-dependent oxidoreductase n=1 Tax=Pseudomonas sp. N3-W TaxID=2975049 RepID=UPI00217DC9DC|nr:SDR family NAD(P)-dependent oxidoreductase [Pseudomonas sp. N3-W]UWF47085.1 SDR family NAD(P)-dependent oxidoreductase [Pseudomonas sp. N3-W]